MMRCSLHVLAIISSVVMGVSCSGDSNPASVDTGTGGNTDAAAPSQCIDIEDDLIANFREDNSLHPADGRQGGFYLYDDGKGTFEPSKVDPYPIDPKNGNTKCSGPGSFHTKATGFNLWGAGMGADLKPMDGQYKGTYDASKYKGVSFWAKAGAALKGVQVSFPDVYSDDKANPNALNPEAFPCVYVSGATNNCSPYLVKFGAQSKVERYANYQIDTEWKRFDVYFEDTRQDEYNPGFHTEADKLDVEHLLGVHVQVNADFSSGKAEPNDFELWIDDVYFMQ